MRHTTVVTLLFVKTKKAKCRHYHHQDDECNMTPKLQGKTILTFSLFFSVFRIGGLNSSVILTSLDYNNYTGKLLSYLEPVFLSSEQSRFVKCWHAKTDGWAASTFHSNCDGRGPTVTIIKVNDYIFGGYTDVSWSGGSYIKFLKRGQDNFIGSTIVPLGI